MAPPDTSIPLPDDAVLSPRFGLGISNCRPASEVVAGVSEAERLGATVAFVAEDVNCRDAFQLLAACAAATTRINLSTGVVNPFTRNPTSLAMAVATLDEMSGGRAQLGLGTSSPALVEQEMGIPHRRSVRVMREAIEIVRALLRGDTVTYAGEIFHYLNARLEARPIRQPVPVVVAAMGPAMLRLAGAVTDGVLLNVGASPAYVRWAVAEIAAGARRAGRDPSELTVAAWLTAYVTDDREAGVQRAREWLATMLSIPLQGELLLEKSGFDTSILAGIRQHVSAYPHTGDPGRAATFVPVEVAEALTLIGNTTEIAARVEAYRAAGVDVPVLGIGPLRALLSPE